MNQPTRAENIEALVQYFKKGIKKEAVQVGIELEHILVHSNGSPVSFSAPDGQRAILESLSDTYPQIERNDEGIITSLSDGVSTITLEPAAQVEISAGPFADLNKALTCIETFENTMNEITGPSIETLGIGYHPTTKAINLELIPKERYHIMNEYLGAISMFGICMMRGSAATQVSIDYVSIDDCLRKLRIANALVPLLSLIADNSPIFEGAPRSHQLVRTEIWQKCDPARCGTVPKVMDPNFTLEDYAEYILDTPAMVDISSGVMRISDTPIGELYAHKVMDEEDIEHVLSVFFTDVRLKHYIEIRPADSLPPAYAIAYAALIKGLFYNADVLNNLDSLFSRVTKQDIDNAKNALMEHGYDACIYGQPVAELADEIISLATSGLDSNEVTLLEPLAALVSQRTTLATIALNENKQ